MAEDKRDLALRVAMLLHTYPTFDGGFSAGFVHELSKALVLRGHEVYAIVPWHPSMQQHQTMDGVRLETFHASRFISYIPGDASSGDRYVHHPNLSIAWSLLDGAFKLLQVVKKHRIDIIHAHWTLPMGFIASMVTLVTRTPLVITMHGRDIRPSSVVTRLRLYRFFLRCAFQRADRLIAVGKASTEYAQQLGASAEKIQVIGNGVNLSQFYPSQEGGVRIRQQYHISHDAKVILAVGELALHKGFDLLIQAMPKVLAKVPEALALIVGEGDQHKALVELRDRLGLQDKVIFVGKVPNTELRPFENTCTVFVMPSRAESFGIATIEAMACAKPVVATRVDGLMDVVVDGETGLHFGFEDIDALARSMIIVLENPDLAHRLGENARRRVEALYSWRHVAQQTEALYRCVLANKNT